MSYITVGKLHKFLGELVAKGHARKPVCIDKATFHHPLESDGATILEVEKGRFMWIPMIDDDGGVKQNKDGTESGRQCLVLRGDDPLGTLQPSHLHEERKF
jgi:hypothetical protein